MKKIYETPVFEIVSLENVHLCTTSEIDVTGETDHYDSRRSIWNRFNDEE